MYNVYVGHDKISTPSNILIFGLLLFILPQNNQNCPPPSSPKKSICAESVLYNYVPTTSSCICPWWTFSCPIIFLFHHSTILNSSSPMHVWHVKTLMIYMYTCLSFPHTFLLYYFRKCTWQDKHYKVTIKPTFLGKSTLYKCSDKTTFPKLKVKKEATVYHNIANRFYTPHQLNCYHDSINLLSI
jgi:hypothetical protein